MADPTARAPDDYERRYMDADRAVMIARVRRLPWLQAASAATVVAVLALHVQQLASIWPRIWALWERAPLAVVLFLVGCVPLWLSLLWFPIEELIGIFTRVVLTPTHLRVHRGLAATDVPLAAVTGVAVERTRRWFPKLPAFGGLARRYVVYQSFRTKESLRVEWRDEKGRSRHLWVYLDEAEALRERIEALRGGGTTGVRVDVGGEGEEEAGGEEVAEAAVVTARGARR